MKAKLTALAQRFSQAAVQPVLFLAIMGTALAVAVILQLDFMPSAIVFLGTLLKTMMDAMLNNLALIFCVGLATAFAKEKKVDAAIISIIVFLMFLAANEAWLSSQGLLAAEGAMGLYGTGQNYVLGFQVVDMNVFLGIILGCITGYVHNRFCKVKFPEMVSVYGGSRFVFLIMIPITLVLAVVLSYVWPFVNNAISMMSEFIKNAGVAGIFLYAFGNRFLVPVGLHHLLWMPFCFTGLGGSAEIGGTVVQGAANIFYAEMGNAAALTTMDSSIRFVTFGFAKIFGSLGIGLAMMHTAKPEHKKAVKGMIIPSLFVALVAGITEPFDFSFLFISPLLWLVHGVLAGVSEVILWVLGSRTFAMNGLLDTIISNSVISPSLTKIYIFFLVGIVMTAVWFVVFTFLIKKLDIKTLGRDDSLDAETESGSGQTGTQAAAGAYTQEDAQKVIEGLGGSDNIVSINNCFTRLRIEVKKPELVKEDLLKQTDQKGVVLNGTNVQIIIGLHVEDVKAVVKGCWKK